jgi:hypothetical protein
MRYALGGKQYVYFPEASSLSGTHHYFNIASDKQTPSWQKTATKIAAFVIGILPALIGLILKLASSENRHARDDWSGAAQEISAQSTCNDFEFAKACCSLVGGWEIIPHFKNRLTQAQKFEVAKLAATENSSPVINHLGKLQLSQEQNFEIAKLCATHWHVIPALMDKKLCGKCPKSLLPNTEIELDLLPEQKFEILKLCPEEHGEILMPRLRYIGLNLEQNFEILKRYIPQNAVEAAENLDKIALSPEHQKELALLTVAYDACALSRVKEFFTKKDFEPFAKLAMKLRCTLYLTFNHLEGLLPQIEILDPSGPAFIANFKKFTNFEFLTKIIQQTISAIFVWTQTLSSEELSWVKKENLLSYISDFKAPDLSPFLTYSAAEIIKNQKARENFNAIKLKFEDKYPWTKLFRIPLVVLKTSGIDSKILDSLITQINSFKELNTPALLSLIRSLINLAKNTTLSIEEKTAILKTLAEGPLLQRAQEFLMILELGEIGLLKDLSQGLPALAQDAFQKAVPFRLGALDNFAERYNSTFGAYRQPEALKVYAGKMKATGDPAASSCLGEHVTSVFDGSYRQRRYALEGNPHLQKIPKEVLEKWQQNQQLPLLELLEGKALSHKEETMFQWLHTKLILDKHMSLNLFPSLQNYLSCSTEEERSASYQNFVESMKNRKNLPQEQQKYLPLQKKLLELARSQTKENSLRLLKELQKIPLPEDCEFSNDLQAQITNFSKKVELGSVFTAHETDDPEDLLLCGTEVFESCQRIDGTPDLNRGLLGYLRHGQTRLLAIKGPDGKIEARALLRLLLDKEKPVLLLECFYGIHRPDFSKAIQLLAKKTAERLECPLTTIISRKEAGIPYSGSLVSEGGPAPYEYVDAVRNVRANGEFTIPKSPELVLL